jgi:hypothetical protein
MAVGCGTSGGSSATKPTGTSAPVLASAQPAAQRVLATFSRAIVAKDNAAAFELLSADDQDRFGSAERFGTELSRSPQWTAATVDPTGAVTVSREAMLDPVFGLVPATARLNLPLVANSSQDSSPRIAWSRRSEVRNDQASESDIEPAVKQWATARQRCESAPAEETVNGLVGVVGLATRLCDAEGPIISTLASGAARDLLDLNDPASVLDAYGDDAANWARVVPLSSPVPMNVVVAPIGSTWKVIATVHVDLPGIASPTP